LTAAQLSRAGEAAEGGVAPRGRALPRARELREAVVAGAGGATPTAMETKDLPRWSRVA
jgi:hypothetical protein